MRSSCRAALRMCVAESRALARERSIAEEDLRVQVHRAHRVLQVVDDEGHEALLLQLDAEEVVALALEQVVVLAKLGAQPAQLERGLHADRRAPSGERAW